MPIANAPSAAAPCGRRIISDIRRREDKTIVGACRAVPDIVTPPGWMCADITDRNTRKARLLDDPPSPPAPVQPEPLLGMLAHPALDHRRHRLHGGPNVDAAFGVALR